MTGGSPADEEYRETGMGFCTLEEKEMKGATNAESCWQG